MSTRPLNVLSSTLRRTRLPLLPLRCIHCHSSLAGTGGGKLRVDAGGKLLGIWLPAAVSHDRTGRITTHDRVPARRLESSPLNSGDSLSLVARVLGDPRVARHKPFALECDSCRQLLVPSSRESLWPVPVPVVLGGPVPVRPARLFIQRTWHQLRGDRSTRQDWRFAGPQHSLGLLARPAMRLRRGPEPGREARWPCPIPHPAAVRARKFLTGRELRSGPARYWRRG
ncbi:hypothetical protein GCM10009661_31540 [Catellatospora chokoriensis]|uniref:Uncharacterized protein n=1 Tax=Catellatospora chokoriensis TaxID=310353 RepID=A0A8J3JZP5_9ACTN|nr:hypothetical protein Cch02nite_36400 [Catellatospora chokoriensis]